MPLAAARAGLVHVPINPLLKRAQVAHILADSGASLLVGTPARLATLEFADLPKECLATGEDEALEAAASADRSLPPSSQDPNALAALLYTSGSTGRPKGVMLSHANMWLGAVSVASYLGLAEDDVTLAVLPLSFDYGQNQLLSTWYAGGSVVPLDYLTPRDVIKACARHGVTTLAAVPPLWVQLVEQDWPIDAVTPMRRLTNSGGALTVELVRKLRTLFPQARLFPMYGLTEAFRSTYLDPALVDSHPTSMGKAIPFVEILVIGDDGDVTAPDEEGELVHCGPLVAQGYWNDPARTAERFRPAPAASRYGGMAVWSGDRVRRDAEGLLYFVGRRDAMIKSAGNRISPQEIEDAALASGLVAEAVALGMPDERLGQSVHLIVRGSGDDEGLKAALKRDLPNFMQPQVIRWVEAMPVNPNGKIDRVALKGELAA
jgi:acyl-CoA ligase (AMP-forming) (exosortase A-associated)